MKNEQASVMDEKQDDPKNLDTLQIPSKPIYQNLYDLEEDEKKDILDQQKERNKTSVTYMQKLWPTMLNQYKKYRSIADPIKDEFGREIEGRANLFVPYPWAIVESTIPRLAGRLPKLHVFPRKEIDKLKSENVQDLLIYTLDRMQFLKIQTAWIRQFEIYGWSPLFYYWRHETKEVLERAIQQDPTGKSLQKLQKTQKVIWDDFFAKILDVWDCFIQPGVEQIEDGDWFQFREYLSRKDIAARVQGGLFYPEVLTYIKENPSPQSHAQEIGSNGRDDRDDLVGQLRNPLDHTYGRYEVIWTLEDDKVIAMIDGKVLARFGDNPNPMQKKPIINLNLLPIMGEPIGIGTVEALGGLPDKLNALSNMRLDNLSIIVNKVIIADRYAQTDFHNLNFTSGNVILTDRMDSVQFMDTPTIGPESEREVQSTKEEMQFSVGISDFLVGNSGKGRLADTATGVSTIVREANARFALKLATLEAYPLRELIYAANAYNSVYMPDSKTIHVLGPKGYVTKDVSLEDVLAEYDISIESGSSAPLDQLSRRDGLLQLYDRLSKAPQTIDIAKITRELLESFDIRNPEQYLIQKDPLNPMDDAKLAEGENVALMQGQEVELAGNDDVHISIHQGELGKAQFKPEALEGFQAHIDAHQKHKASMTAMGAMTLFGGGQNGSQQQPAEQGSTIPNPFGIGGAPAGGQGGMASGGGMAQNGGGNLGQQPPRP